MSSFLDSTGLSRLVSKITDYFAKKDGTYPDMTVGNVSNVVPVAKLPTASSVTSGDTTHVPTADAVAQAVAGKISVYDGKVASSSVGSSQWSKVADATAYNNSQAAGIWIVTYGTEFADGSNPRQDFAILSVNFRGDTTNKPYKICFNLTTFYSWDASTYAISIVTRGRTVELWAKNSGSYRAIQFAQILNDRGGNNVRWKYYATSLTNKPVEDPSNNIYVYDAVICNSRDASWINSGTFDTARIPTSLPNVTVGNATTASDYNTSSGTIRSALSNKMPINIFNSEYTGSQDVAVTNEGHYYIVASFIKGDWVRKTLILMSYSEHNCRSGIDVITVEMTGTQTTSKAEWLHFGSYGTGGGGYFKYKYKDYDGKIWLLVHYETYSARPVVISNRGWTVYTSADAAPSSYLYSGSTEFNMNNCVHTVNGMGSPTRPVYILPSGSPQVCSTYISMGTAVADSNVLCVF